MPYGETGYIEQGYANVAALPYEMQLMDVQTRRMQLEQNQINTRTMRRTEMDDVRNRQQFDDYSEFFQNNPDATPEQIDGFFQEDLSRMRNPMIKEAFNFGKEKDDILTKRVENKLTRKETQFNSDALEYRIKNLQEERDASAIARRANMVNAELQLKQAQDLTEQDFHDNITKYATDISGAFRDHPEIQKKSITLASHFGRSKDEFQQQVGRSMHQIASAFSVANNLEQIESSFFGENEQFFQEYDDLVKGGRVDSRNVEGLLRDSSTMQETLELMNNNLMAKGASPDVIERYKNMASSLAAFNQIQEDKKNLMENYTTYVNKLEELSKGQPTPEQMREIEDLGSILNTTAVEQLGYVAKKQGEISGRLKLNEEKTKRQKDQYELLKKIQDYELAPKKLAISQFRAMVSQQNAVDGSRMSKIGMATRIIDSGQAEQIFPELKSGYDLQDVIKSIESMKVSDPESFSDKPNLPPE